MCIAINWYEYYFLLQNMQRRDSLGSTSKIPRLGKGSTRKFKSSRSQSSFSSASDVFADNEATKGHADLSVNKMKLRSEKNLDGSHGLSAEVGPESEALVDPFDEGNKHSSDQTLSQVRTSNGKKSKGRKRPRTFPRSNREKKCCSEERPNRRLRLISGEGTINSGQAEQKCDDVEYKSE